MKIAVNSCWGGFSLSEKAYNELGLSWDGFGYKYIDYEKRSDPDLIRVIEKLGDEANGSHAKIRIVEIPEGVDWEIDNYDGQETVREKSRSW